MRSSSSSASTTSVKTDDGTHTCFDDVRLWRDEAAMAPPDSVVPSATGCATPDRILARRMSVATQPPDEAHTTISVIIACYNAGQTLAEQLEGLAEQEYGEPWELIIADNGSTDDSLALVERYRPRLATVRVVDASRVQGAAHARNVGAAAARGPYLAFCDADDVVGKGWLRALSRAVQRYDFAASRFEGERLNPPEVLRIRQCPQQDGLMTFKYSRFLPFAGACGLAVRRSLFDTLGGFDEELLSGEDIDFCWRAQLSGTELHFADDAVVHIRLRSEPREVIRQAEAYGFWTVPLYVRYRRHGMSPVPWQAGAWRWLRLLARAPRLARRSSRTKWLREFAYRRGLLKGSIRYRTIAL